MSERAESLRKTWENRTTDAIEKVRSAIRVMVAEEEEISFSSVSRKSGVARSFLYKNQEIKAEIEKYREQTIDIRQCKAEQRLKTKRSRDTVIEAKDRRIKKLEEEIRQLKLELDTLRGQLYDSK
jgi:hypothetical protein